MCVSFLTETNICKYVYMCIHLLDKCKSIKFFVYNSYAYDALLLHCCFCEIEHALKNKS